MNEVTKIENLYKKISAKQESKLKLYYIGSVICIAIIFGFSYLKYKPIITYIGLILIFILYIIFMIKMLKFRKNFSLIIFSLLFLWLGIIILKFNEIIGIFFLGAFSSTFYNILRKQDETYYD